MGDGSVSSPSKFHRLCSEGTCLFSLFSPNYFQLQNCLLGETTFYLFIFSSCRTSGLPAPTSSHFWYFSPKLRSAGSLYLSLQYLCTCWDFSSALSPAVEVLQMEKKKKSPLGAACWFVRWCFSNVVLLMCGWGQISRISGKYLAANKFWVLHFSWFTSSLLFTPFFLCFFFFSFYFIFFLSQAELYRFSSWWLPAVSLWHSILFFKLY